MGRDVETRFGGPRANQGHTLTAADRERSAMGRGRPSYIDTHENQILVAEAFVAGLTHTLMAEKFGVDRNTIARWRRDPRIKAHCHKLIEDRVLTVTRKVDSEIEARLAHAKDMSTKELLEIRKEFLGGAFRAQTEGNDDDTITQAMALLEKRPDLAEQMIALLSGDVDVVSPAEKDDEIPVTT